MYFLSDYIKYKIIYLHENNMKIKEIARTLCINVSVYYFVPVPRLVELIFGSIFLISVYLNFSKGIGCEVRLCKEKRVNLICDNRKINC